MRRTAALLVLVLAVACGKAPPPAAPGAGRPVGTVVVEHPAGVRFAAPAAWTCAVDGRALRVTPGGGRTVECALEVLGGLDLPDAAGPEAQKAVDSLFLSRSMSFERPDPAKTDAGRPALAEYSYHVRLDGRPYLRARGILRVEAGRPALIATMIGPGDQIDELTPEFRTVIGAASFRD